MITFAKTKAKTPFTNLRRSLLVAIAEDDVYGCLNSLSSSLITPSFTPHFEASRTRAVTPGQVNSGLVSHQFPPGMA